MAASCTLLIALLAAAGCSKPVRPGYHIVTGSITFDGQPLADGFVQFCPTDSKIPPESGRIEKGRYRLESKAGKAVVQVLATRDAGKIDKITGSPMQEMYIPQRYNSKSELTADVVADKANTIDFNLTSR